MASKDQLYYSVSFTLYNSLYKRQFPIWMMLSV